MSYIKNVPHSEVFELKDAVTAQPGQVNSLTLSQLPGCRMTLFAFDIDESISSHSASGDALIYVLEGTCEVTINEEPFVLEAGQSVVMTAGAPHAVRALTAFKMLLVVAKD